MMGAGFSRPHEHRPDAVYYLDVHFVLAAVERDKKPALAPADIDGACPAARGDMKLHPRSASSRARAFHRLARGSFAGSERTGTAGSERTRPPLRGCRTALIAAAITATST